MVLVIEKIQDQISSLIWAAEKQRSNLVDAISPHCSLLEQIKAEELLSSAFVCGSVDNRDVEQAFEHFYGVIKHILDHDIPKILISTTTEILDNRQECQILDQLKELRSNLDNIYIEALFIRERVLRSANEEDRHSFFYRGAVLADNKQYHRAVNYWVYELDLRRQYAI